MKMDELFEEYDCDTEHRAQAIFSCIFILLCPFAIRGK